MADESADQPRPLAGCRVLVTREHPGELGTLLAEHGAEVAHVPLIAGVDAPDGGEALRRELDRLDEFDWIFVTSPAGAERVGEAARRSPGVSLAAVGTATARELAELADRPVDLVPARQLATALAAEFNDIASSPQRVLVAQADRAADTLADALRDGGHDVSVVTAYSTVLSEPDMAAVGGADVLVLASGSAAESWAAAIGATGPPVVVAIGPSTAKKARELGLKVSGVAADHSLVGLVDEVVRQVTQLRLHDSP
jgi:uroporphyrinogen-III synthase